MDRFITQIKLDTTPSFENDHFKPDEFYDNSKIYRLVSGQLKYLKTYHQTPVIIVKYI